jgi:hypothetical protein
MVPGRFKEISFLSERDLSHQQRQYLRSHGHSRSVVPRGKWVLENLLGATAAAPARTIRVFWGLGLKGITGQPAVEKRALPPFDVFSANAEGRPPRSLIA